ncbi:hypothetical protein LRP88_13942 [Fusarium phalaenopsidis]
MRLNQRNVDIFFATAPAFVASLPPAPDRDKALEDVMLALTNSVVSLRFEFTRLRNSFSIEWAATDLPKSDCAEANIALEDILDMLDNLVDDSIWRPCRCASLKSSRVDKASAEAIFGFLLNEFITPRIYDIIPRKTLAPLSLSTATTKSLTLWGAFLEKIRLGTTAQQERLKNGRFTMESLETIYLSEDPSPEEIKARCNDPLVREYMRLDSLLCSPVYMVTGIKIAKGFKLEGEQSSSASIEFEGGGEISQEASIGIKANAAATKKERIVDEFESDSDIVFAYQLMKITPKGWRKEKRLKTGEYQHRQGFLQDEKEAEEEEVEVEIGEVSPDDMEGLKGVQVLDSVEGRVAFV